jgi:hypothetical protein
MYLWYYEFKFIQQLVGTIVACPPDPAGHSLALDILLGDPQAVPAQDLHRLKGNVALALLKLYRFTFRFVDDLLSGTNPFFKRLLFLDQQVFGGWFHGMYPRFFHIIMQDMQGDSLPFLDVLLRFSLQGTNGVRMRLTPEGQVQPTGEQGLVVMVDTLLYDKRRQTCYADIPIVQYTHATSNLSRGCIYNILVGQLHRFSRLISVVDNYVSEVSLLMEKLLGLGYCFRPLLRRLKDFQHTYVQFYPQMADGVIVRRVREALAQKGLP